MRARRNPRAARSKPASPPLPVGPPGPRQECVRPGRSRPESSPTRTGTHQESVFRAPTRPDRHPLPGSQRRLDLERARLRILRRQSAASTGCFTGGAAGPSVVSRPASFASSPVPTCTDPARGLKSGYNRFPRNSSYTSASTGTGAASGTGPEDRESGKAEVGKMTELGSPEGLFAGLR